MATREGDQSGDDSLGIEPNWAAAGAEPSVRRSGSQCPLSPSPQFVGGGFGGWYLPSPVSLALSLSDAKKAVRVVGFADHKRNSGNAHGTGRHDGQ